MVIMSESYQIETRQTHPHYRFETRVFHCPDKVTRLVTLHSGMWHYFDKAHRLPRYSLEETIALCTETSLSHKNLEQHSFCDILHYWIIVYARYEKAAREGKSIMYAELFNMAVCRI